MDCVAAMFPKVSFDWPAKFPDLTVFSCGGRTHLKAKVCMYTHQTLEELKQYFRDEITVTNKGLFRTVMVNF